MTRLLFVCTGNTCRSPMAEVIARHAAADRGLAVETRSAGLMAGAGQPAAEHARELARERGLDLAGHRSTPISAELLAWADLVLGLTHRHVAALRAATPAGRLHVLTHYLPEGDPRRDAPVADPFGGDRAAYAAAWEEIETAVGALLDRLAEE